MPEKDSRGVLFWGLKDQLFVDSYGVYQGVSGCIYKCKKMRQLAAMQFFVSLNFGGTNRGGHVYFKRILPI